MLNKLAEKYGDIQLTPEMQLQNWENLNENLSGFNLNESDAKYSKKYNPDYSETDRTLDHNRGNDDHEEKNIDQT